MWLFKLRRRIYCYWNLVRRNLDRRRLVARIQPWNFREPELHKPHISSEISRIGRTNLLRRSIYLFLTMRTHRRTREEEPTFSDFYEIEKKENNDHVVKRSNRVRASPVAGWLNHRAFNTDVHAVKLALSRSTNCELYRTHYNSWSIPWARRRMYMAARSFARSRPCIPRAPAKDVEEQQRARRGVSAVVIVADVRKHWNPFTFRARGNPAPRGARIRVARRCKFSKEFLASYSLSCTRPLLSGGTMSGAVPEGFSLKFAARNRCNA